MTNGPGELKARLQKRVAQNTSIERRSIRKDLSTGDKVSKAVLRNRVMKDEKVAKPILSQSHHQQRKPARVST
jgi:hypothetical protein